MKKKRDNKMALEKAPEKSLEKEKWLILTVIVIKMIMDGLDGSMLNIALPTISKSLGVTSGAIIWIVSSYSITTSAAVLFFGRLGDIIGKTKFYIIGIAIYAISTLFGGLADSLATLVASRVVMAIGASCTMANSQGIIAMVFPQHQRGRALGIYGSAISIGSLAGPALGGLIVTHLNWQYIFWLKAPFAVAAFLLGIKYFPKDTPSKKETVDYPGAFLYIIAIVPLLYSLQQGYASGYTSVAILSGLALSLVAFTAFFTLQVKKPMPLLDLGIFKNPVYSVNLFVAFLLSFTFSFQGVIIPFYMQGVLNISAATAGLYMTISPVIMLLVTPVSGYLCDKVGGDILVAVGQTISCAGMLMLATLTKDSRILTMMIYFCIITFGSSLFQAPNNALIISSLPPDKFGIGGSASMAVRMIGSTLGTAFTTAVLYGGMSKVLGYRVTGYTQGSGQDDAFMYGMNNAFIIAAALCVLATIVSVLRVIRLKKDKANLRSLQGQE